MELGNFLESQIIVCQHTNVLAQNLPFASINKEYYVIVRMI